MNRIFPVDPHYAGWAMAAASGLTTYLGGRIGLRLRPGHSVVLGLAGGMVMGIALLDVLGDAFKVAGAHQGPRMLLLAFAAGLLGYILLERVMAARATLLGRCNLAPLPLLVHSIIDGLSMGLAFAVSPGVGLSVGWAVIAHDLADGLNTVGLARLRSDHKVAHRWVLANSCAPLVGFGMGTLVQVPQDAEGFLLAFFAGGLLSVAMGEVIPRALAAQKGPRPVIAILAGIAASYLISR